MELSADIQMRMMMVVVMRGTSVTTLAGRASHLLALGRDPFDAEDKSSPFARVI